MAKPTEYHDNWEHGFIRIDQKGRKTFWIRVQTAGKRIKVSTGAHDLQTAMKEYEVWAKNPSGYVRGTSVGLGGTAAVYLDQVLIDRFLDWSRKAGHKGHGNTLSHVSDQRIALNFWLTHLGRRDLKRLDLDRDILPPLKDQPQQVNRRKTLKSFYSWLRSDAGRDANGYRFRIEDDPTSALEVAKNDPTRRHRPDNKAVPWDHILAVRNALTGNWKDIFKVQMASGWHATELLRFARSGSIEVYSGPMGAAGVLVCPLHKIGNEHRTAVNAETLEAARAVRAYGGFNPKRYTRIVEAAATELGKKQPKKIPEDLRIKPFTAGQLRHSVATYMIGQGATVYEVATFLGHRSLETTKKFYATHAIPWNPMLAINPTRILTVVS